MCLNSRRSTSLIDTVKEEDETSSLYDEVDTLERRRDSSPFHEERALTEVFRGAVP